MHLDEIEPCAPQHLRRVRHLLDPGTLAARPHLGGKERALVHVRHQQLTQHALGGRVHRRGVDQTCAGGEEPLQHVLERCALGSGLADFESPRGAQADDGELFGARGDLAHDQRIARVRSARP